eukprot:9258775-Karenia_brevis.AAC.1
MASIAKDTDEASRVLDAHPSDVIEALKEQGHPRVAAELASQFADIETFHDLYKQGMLAMNADP